MGFMEFSQTLWIKKKVIITHWLCLRMPKKISEDLNFKPFSREGFPRTTYRGLPLAVCILTTPPSKKNPVSAPVSSTLTFFSGFQFDEEGSGLTGAPSLNMQHVSLGTSGRYDAMISAVSLALIRVEQTSLVYLRFRSFSLWPVVFACNLNPRKNCLN